jgi:glyoxylase-like metal-dependent hydrolase (beta-lactamase superfamily II)
MTMASTIHPFVTGDFLAPPDHRLAGQRVLVVAYLIRHPKAVVLLDTGFPWDDKTTVNDADVPLPTSPRSMAVALATLGTSLEAVDLVVNCHLHIDHAGGNHRVPPTTPILVQAVGHVDALAETDPMVRDALALEARNYQPTDGEHEPLPGLWIVPTPGHTRGHQSVLVDTRDGRVLLAGQSMPSASEFAHAAYALELERTNDEPMPPYADWLPRIMELGPSSAMFAHDLATWDAATSAAALGATTRGSET